MLKRIMKFVVRFILYFHFVRNSKFLLSLFAAKDFNLIIYDENERRILLPFNKEKFAITKDFSNNSLEFIFRKIENDIFVLKTARVNTDGKIMGYQNMQDVAILYHDALGIRKHIITIEDFFIFIPNFKKEEKVNLILTDIPIHEVEKFKAIYKQFI